MRYSSILAVILWLTCVQSAFAFSNEVGVKPLSPSSNYAMVGMGGSGDFWDIEYTATTTYEAVSAINLPICRYGGTDTGTFYIEVRGNSTTSAVIASSSITAVGITTTNCTVSTTNATTTKFNFGGTVLSIGAGQTYYFRIISSGLTGTFYFTFANESLSTSNFYTYFNGGGKYEIAIGQYGTIAIESSTYVTTWDTLEYIYNASSSNVSCDTFDVGCYVSIAINQFWSNLIDPDVDIMSQLKDQLLYGFPYGYITDIITILATTSTTSLTFYAEMPDVMPCSGCEVILDTYRILDPILYATSGAYTSNLADSSADLYTITSVYWHYFMGICLVFYYLVRILGATTIPKINVFDEVDNTYHNSPFEKRPRIQNRSVIRHKTKPKI